MAGVAMELSEMLTYSTVMIKCQYVDGTIGSGTGFIVNLCKDEENKTCKPALITNYHVVDGSVKTIFEFCMADKNGNPMDKQPYSFTYEGNSWIHHPDKDVDLCCLFLADALNLLKDNGISVFYIPLDTDLIPNKQKLAELSAIEDIIMIGYPIGLSDNYNHKPVVRKGITSSHPRKDYQGKKETLLDIACFPGSSGSPVFIFNQGSFSTSKGITVGTRIMLLGVLYGGPEFSTEGCLQFANVPNTPVPVMSIPMNLGVMIKAERILEFEEMIKNS